MYLGEINDQQQAAWRKTLDVFVDEEQRHTALSLLPEDPEIPADAPDSVQVKRSGLEIPAARAAYFEGRWNRIRKPAAAIAALCATHTD